MEEVIKYLYNRKIADTIVLDEKIKLKTQNYYEEYGVK